MIVSRLGIMLCMYVGTLRMSTTVAFVAGFRMLLSSIATLRLF